jgi:hypothetical protein
MALPFNRSIRALRSDREGFALTMLALAVVLLFFWAIWFLFAPIPRYETGQVVGVNRSGALIAIFPAQARLEPGQLAQVRLSSEQGSLSPSAGMAGMVAGGSSRPILAMVMFVEQNDRSNQITAELATLSDPSRDMGGESGEAILRSLAQDVGGGRSPVRVEVEVGQISPAQLILRAAGQWMGGRLSISMLIPGPRPDVDSWAAPRGHPAGHRAAQPLIPLNGVYLAQTGQCLTL